LFAAYEAAGLAIFSGKSQPNAFETRAGAFSFPEPARPGLVPVVVEVPAGATDILVSFWLPEGTETVPHAIFEDGEIVNCQIRHRPALLVLYNSVEDHFSGAANDFVLPLLRGGCLPEA